MSQQESLEPDQVRSALDRIVSRGGGEQASLWDRFWEWLDEFFSQTGPDVAAPAGWWNVLQLVVLGLATLALVVLIVRALVRWGRARMGRAGSTGKLTVPVPERVAKLRREAQRARESGDWQLALQKQFFALVLGLGERGDLEFRDAWTNRELLVLGSPAPAVQAVLAPLLEELEPKEFGRMQVEAKDLDRLEALAGVYFGALPGSPA